MFNYLYVTINCIIVFLSYIIPVSKFINITMSLLKVILNYCVFSGKHIIWRHCVRYVDGCSIIFCSSQLTAGAKAMLLHHCERQLHGFINV